MAKTLGCNGFGQSGPGLVLIGLVIVGMGIAGCPFAGPPVPAPIKTLRAGIVTDAQAAKVGARINARAVILERPDDDSPISYEWSFAGAHAEGPSVEVSVSSPGVVEVQLTARQGHVTTNVSSTLNFYEQAGAPFGVAAGDINRDGKLSLLDAYQILRLARGATAGTHEQRLAADVNANGRITLEDALAVSNAIAQKDQFPSGLSVARVYPGTLVTLFDQTLLDPASVVRVEGTLISPNRAVPGYATFLIPPEIFGPNPHTPDRSHARVDVMVNGESVRAWLLPVDPLPALTGEPGLAVRQLITGVSATLPEFEAAYAELLDMRGVDAKQREVFRAMLNFAVKSWQESAAEWDRNFASMPKDMQRRLHAVAAANGLSDGLNNISAYQTNLKSKRLSARSARTLEEALALECQIKDFADFMDDVVGTIQRSLCISIGSICTVSTAICLLAPESVLPCADAALFCPWVPLVCGLFGNALDIISVLTEAIPRPTGLRLQDRPSQGGGEIDVFLQIDVRGCDTNGLAFATFIKNKLVESAIRALTSRFAPQAVVDKIREHVVETIGSALGAAGLDDAVSAAVTSLCEGSGMNLTVSEMPVPSNRLSTAFVRVEDSSKARVTTSSGPIIYECLDSGTARIWAWLASCRPVFPTGYYTKSIDVSCGTTDVTIEMGDNGPALDDIFEVRIDGQSVLTSNAPVRSVTTSKALSRGQHQLQMVGLAAPDGIGTYFIRVTGATLSGGPALSGTNLTAGTVFSWILEVQ